MLGPLRLSGKVYQLWKLRKPQQWTEPWCSVMCFHILPPELLVLLTGAIILADIKWRFTPIVFLLTAQLLYRINFFLFYGITLSHPWSYKSPGVLDIRAFVAPGLTLHYKMLIISPSVYTTFLMCLLISVCFAETYLGKLYGLVYASLSMAQLLTCRWFDAMSVPSHLRTYQW